MINAYSKFVIGAAVLALAGCASTGSPASTASGSPPPVATSSLVPLPEAQYQVQSWENKGGSAAIRSLVNAFNGVVKAEVAGPLDANPVMIACQRLQGAVSAVRAAGPIPYQPAEKWLAAAVEQIATGSADCMAGKVNVAVTTLQKGGSDVTNAEKAINVLFHA